MEWTLSDIRLKVRKLAGRPDAGQISDADLDEFINNYYQNLLPLELVPEELEGWYTLPTVGNDEDYDLEEKYLTLKVPFTIAGWPINFWLNKSLFYAKFPETQTYNADRPTDVLFYNRILLFRPKPDTIYQFKAAVISRPDPLSNPTDKPLNQLWGPMISYASAIDIKSENGEEIESLRGLYDFYLTQAKRPEICKMEGQRSIPRF